MKPNIMPDTSGQLAKLFAGFQFCTLNDAWMAATVVGWIRLAHEFNPARDEAFRPPLVIISGPPGCGKNTLAVRLGVLACDVERVAFMDGSEGDENIEFHFHHCATFDYPAVAFDCGRGVFASDILSRILTAESLSFRPFRQKEPRVKKLGIVTMLLCNGDGTVSDDLERRAVHIRLAARLAVPPVKKRKLPGMPKSVKMAPAMLGAKPVKKGGRKAA